MRGRLEGAEGGRPPAAPRCRTRSGSSAPWALHPAGGPQGTRQAGLDSSRFDLWAPVPSPAAGLPPRAADSAHVGGSRALRRVHKCFQTWKGRGVGGREEGRGGGWGGRRYADSESEFPLESLKSVHVLKKNGTNLRSQPRGHVPPPAALPPRRPRSLLPAVAARAPSPSPPIGGSAFGGTLGPEKLGPYK